MSVSNLRASRSWQCFCLRSVRQQVADLRRYSDLMTDVFWVAVITALGTLLGTAVGSLASIFGPAWHERKRREADAARSLEDLRYQRAQLFIDGLSRQYAASSRGTSADIEALRIAFVATLRPGENVADEFTRDLVDRVYANPKDSIDIANHGGSRLLGWLRGDLTSAELLP